MHWSLQRHHLVSLKLECPDLGAVWPRARLYKYRVHSRIQELGSAHRPTWNVRWNSQSGGRVRQDSSKQAFKLPYTPILWAVSKSPWSYSLSSQHLSPLIGHVWGTAAMGGPSHPNVPGPRRARAGCVDTARSLARLLAKFERSSDGRECIALFPLSFRSIDYSVDACL